MIFNAITKIEMWKTITLKILNIALEAKTFFILIGFFENTTEEQKSFSFEALQDAQGNLCFR